MASISSVPLLVAGNAHKQDCGCDGAHGRSHFAKEQETLYNSVGNLTPGIPEHTTTSRILVERH